MSTREKLNCLVWGIVAGYLVACLLDVLPFAHDAEAQSNLVATANPPQPTSVAGLTLPAPKPTAIQALQWEGNGETGVSNYIVNFGFKSDTNSTAIRVGITNYFRLTNLWAGSNYTAWVTAEDSDRKVGAPSNFIDFTAVPPLPPLISIRYSQVALDTYGFPGFTNVIQASFDLKNWAEVCRFVAKTNQVFTCLQDLGAKPRFFRVTKVP